MARLAARQLAVISGRTLGLALGGAGIIWGVATFPAFRQQAPLEWIASRVVAGEPIKLDALAGLMATVKAAEQARYCRPDAVRSTAIIRLRFLEETIRSGEVALIDSLMRELADSVRGSLSCAPADPFLWFVLYWLENARGGLDHKHFEYLRMSYMLGPNEGWIGVKRNRFAIAVFEHLPPDLADMAISEFAHLLESGFNSDVVAILTGPGWRIRDRLLHGLRNVPKIHREGFSRALYWQGYDVDVPGIPRIDQRWW